MAIYAKYLGNHTEKLTSGKCYYVDSSDNTGAFSITDDNGDFLSSTFNSKLWEPADTPTTVGNRLLVTTKVALDQIRDAMDGTELEPYHVVEMMEEDMRSSLGDAIYAYYANQQHGLDVMQGLTASEYYLDELGG